MSDFSNFKAAVRLLKVPAIEVFKMWNSEAPHFGGSMPHRYLFQDGKYECVYCLRPHDWRNPVTPQSIKAKKYQVERTPKGHASRKAIGTRVMLASGAKVTITDVRKQWIHFSDGTRGYIGHIIEVLNPLSCDMRKDCSACVSHIDRRGFVYCQEHGRLRAASEPCRQLTASELQTLRNGRTIEF